MKHWVTGTQNENKSFPKMGWKNELKTFKWNVLQHTMKKITSSIMITIGLNYTIKSCLTDTQEKWNRVQFEETTEILLREACAIFTKKQVVKYLGSKPTIVANSLNCLNWL